MRLACMYALLDCSHVIRCVHLEPGPQSAPVATVISTSAASYGPMPETKSFLVSLVAFDDHICKALLALDKGDSACVTGSGKPSTWIGRDGAPCLGLNVKVEHLMTQYSLTKKRAVGKGEARGYGLPAVRPVCWMQSELDNDGTGPF